MLTVKGNHSIFYYKLMEKKLELFPLLREEYDDNEKRDNS